MRKKYKWYYCGGNTFLYSKKFVVLPSIFLPTPEIFWPSIYMYLHTYTVTHKSLHTHPVLIGLKVQKLSRKMCLHSFILIFFLTKQKNCGSKPQKLRWHNFTYSTKITYFSAKTLLYSRYQCILVCGWALVGI